MALEQVVCLRDVLLTVEMLRFVIERSALTELYFRDSYCELEELAFIGWCLMPRFSS